MVDKNIQMKKREGNSWNNLYPITLTENVFNNEGLPLSNELNNFKSDLLNNVNTLTKSKVSEKDTLVYMFDFSLKYSSKCSLVIAGGKNILIDTGDHNHIQDAITKMNDMGIVHLDMVIISHYHSDHSGGMENLLASGLMDNSTDVYLPPSPDWEFMKTIGTQGGSKVTDWQSNETVTFDLLTTAEIGYSFPNNRQWLTLTDDVSVRFHNASVSYFSAYYNDLTNDNVKRDGIDYNNFSMVTEIKNGKKHFVFTGDLGVQGQKQLRGTFENNIYFYDVEHHGLNYTFDSEYFKQINPKYTGIQNADMDYSYYSRGAYGYLKSIGSEIYITGINGDIIFHDSVEGMNITTSRNNGLAETGHLHTYSLTGGYTILEDGADLNTVIEAGIYLSRNTANSNSLVNTPRNNNPTNETFTSSFKMIVETYNDATRFRQTIYENSGRGFVWYRTFSTNNDFNPWYRLMRTSDLNDNGNGTGDHIANDTDLNTLTTVGKYSAPTNTIGSSAINKPEEVDSGFTLEVYPLHHTERFYQILKTTKPLTEEYTRLYNGSWNPWFKVQKVEVT